LVKLLSKFGPAAIRRNLEERPELRAAVMNANWLLVGRAGYMLIGLVVGIWVARYLGPARYGVLNYAVAFAALFSVLSALGLNFIVVRNLVQDPGGELATMGSSAAVKLIGAVVQLVATGVAIWFLRSGEPDYVSFVMIASLSYFFGVFDVIDYWFQARVESRQVVFANLGANLVVGLVKIALILVVAPLSAFVWMLPLTSFLYAVGLIAMHRRHSGAWFTAWKVRAAVLKPLFKDAWPLSLSAFATIIYMKIDQVMIGQMLDEASLGQYSVAVRLSETWFFLPMALSGSFFPALIKIREKSRELYLERLQTAFDVFFWFSAIVALAISFFSQLLVDLLYGAEYAAAGAVLAVHIWSGVFVFTGVLSSRHLIVENLTRIALYRTVAGAIVNVALNLVFIPWLGIIGAAWATLASYAVSGWLANVAFRDARGIFVMQLQSLNPWSLKRYL
jgi:polysaccharide transporter, PST family